MNKTNKNYKRSQKGRSMVEMLGVLAIVGVLSVGGVYGYGVAMKKHKANELLHRASMLASTVSAQIMSGKEPTTLDTFADSNLGKFALDYDPTKTTFDLAISEMDSAVCVQMEKMAGGMVRGVDCDESGNATITYYKNLATNDEEGKNSPTGVKPECSPACQEGEQCIGGVCAKVEPNSCPDYESDLYCSAFLGCSQNADCDDWCATNGDGEECYCAITADFLENDSACYKNFTGQCAVAGKEDYNDGYIVSSDSMSWWSAVNFCKAHGKSLVNLSDLGLSEDCMQTQGCYDYEFIRSKVGAGFDTWLMDSLGDGFEHYNHHNFCFPLRLNYEGASGLVRYLVEDTGALCH